MRTPHGHMKVATETCRSSRKGYCAAHTHAGMSSRDERSKWHSSMTSQSSSNVETQRRLLPPMTPSTRAPGGVVLPGKALPLPTGCIAAAAAAQRWVCLHCKLSLRCGVTRQAHLVLTVAGSCKLRRLASPIPPARASSVRTPVDDMVLSHL